MEPAEDTFLVGDFSASRSGYGSAPPVEPRDIPWTGWCPFWTPEALQRASKALRGKTWRARTALLSSFVEWYIRDWAGEGSPTLSTFENRVIGFSLAKIKDGDHRGVLDAIILVKATLGTRMGAQSFTWRAAPDCTPTCRALDGMKVLPSDILNRGILSAKIGGHGCRCDIVPNLTWESPSEDQFLRAVALRIPAGLKVRYSTASVKNAPAFWRSYIDRVVAAYPDIRWEFVPDAYDLTEVALMNNGPGLFGCCPYAITPDVIYVSDYAAELVALDHVMLRAAFHREYTPSAAKVQHVTMSPDAVLEVAPHVVEAVDGCYRAAYGLLSELGEDGYIEEAVSCGVPTEVVRLLLDGGTIGLRPPPFVDLFEAAFLERKQAFDAALLKDRDHAGNQEGVRDRGAGEEG